MSANPPESKCRPRRGFTATKLQLFFELSKEFVKKVHIHDYFASVRPD